MDTEIIQELIGIMDDAELTALRYDDGNLKVELERSAQHAPAIPAGLAERAAQFLTSRDSAAVGTSQAAPNQNNVVVRSPMVGTFYAAPSPDEEPFVRVGQDVQAGQTLCIVEAMKTMNEIVAETSGTITEVLVANQTQVEYDQPLFTIKAE
jgi:acetyl-CoA carboxylase biotin carboxyl carrier protein